MKAVEFEGQMRHLNPPPGWDQNILPCGDLWEQIQCQWCDACHRLLLAAAPVEPAAQEGKNRTPSSLGTSSASDGQGSPSGRSVPGAGNDVER